MTKMTSVELEAIEIRCHDFENYVTEADVRALIAEVRRLREALTGIREDAWGGDDDLRETVEEALG